MGTEKEGKEEARSLVRGGGEIGRHKGPLTSLKLFGLVVIVNDMELFWEEPRGTKKWLAKVAIFPC